LEAISASQYSEAPVELLTWVRPITESKTRTMMKEMEKWLASIGLSTKLLDILSGDASRISTGDLLVFIKAIADKANRAQARAIYLKLNSDLNAGSLFLMAHPTQPAALYRANFRAEPWRHFHTEVLQPGPAVLWTGDAPAQVLHQFLRDAKPRLTDVIQVAYMHQFPHHGSASSVSPRWLHAIGERWSKLYPMSVISAGRSNSFGHPSPEALWRCPSIAVSEGSPSFEASLEWR
jgi:hypothetical protein